MGILLYSAHYNSPPGCNAELQLLTRTDYTSSLHKALSTSVSHTESEPHTETRVRDLTASSEGHLAQFPVSNKCRVKLSMRVLYFLFEILKKKKMTYHPNNLMLLALGSLEFLR